MTRRPSYLEDSICGPFTGLLVGEEWIWKSDHFVFQFSDSMTWIFFLVNVKLNLIWIHHLTTWTICTPFWRSVVNVVKSLALSCTLLWLNQGSFDQNSAKIYGQNAGLIVPGSTQSFSSHLVTHSASVPNALDLVIWTHPSWSWSRIAVGSFWFAETRATRQVLMSFILNKIVK